MATLIRAADAEHLTGCGSLLNTKDYLLHLQGLHFSHAAPCKAKLKVMYFDSIVYYWNDFIFSRQSIFANVYYNKPSLRGSILRKMQLKYTRNTTKTPFSTSSQQINLYPYPSTITRK